MNETRTFRCISSIAWLVIVAAGCAENRWKLIDRESNWQTVLEMRASKADAGSWIAWAKTLPSPSRWVARGGGSYFLGARRCLMTKHYWKCHWGDDWTPGSSTVKFELPRGEYVWIEKDWTVVPMDDPSVESLAASDDAWILVVRGELVSVIGLVDGCAITIQRPRP